MAITARSLEGVSVVAVSLAGNLKPPDPQDVFLHYGGNSGMGARFLDDTALRVRTFTFPETHERLIFEPTRIRIEALTPKKPIELKLGERLGGFVASLYPEHPFARFGFNYDITYQYDAVIPQREIVDVFADSFIIEQMTHFGWQCTLSKDKGTRSETYFFKAISPLELRILTNIEFNRILPTGAIAVQKLYEDCYTEAQEIVSHLTFT